MTLEQYSPQSNSFAFDRLGDHLDSFQEADKPANHSGLFVERTSYGTTIAGRIDLIKRSRKILAESRAKMRFIDGASPECIVASSSKSAVMVNAATGAQLVLPSSCSTRRTARGIVIWTPVEAPRKAWLYDPTRWQGKAWWNPEVRSGDGNAVGN